MKMNTTASAMKIYWFSKKNEGFVNENLYQVKNLEPTRFCATIRRVGINTFGFVVVVVVVVVVDVVAVVVVVVEVVEVDVLVAVVVSFDDWVVGITDVVVDVEDDGSSIVVDSTVGAKVSVVVGSSLAFTINYIIIVKKLTVYTFLKIPASVLGGGAAVAVDSVVISDVTTSTSVAVVKTTFGLEVERTVEVLKELIEKRTNRQISLIKFGLLIFTYLGNFCCHFG